MPPVTPKAKQLMPNTAVMAVDASGPREAALNRNMRSISQHCYRCGPVLNRHALVGCQIVREECDDD